MAKTKRETEEVPGQWKNRIVRTGHAKVDELFANPKNWRGHTEAQTKALLTVLEKVGWVDSVIVNEITGTLLDGHLRVDLARKNGIQEIPTSYVRLSEEEEDLMLAAFDIITQMARPQMAPLRELFDRIERSEPLAGLDDLFKSLRTEIGLDTLWAPDQDLVDRAQNAEAFTDRQIFRVSCRMEDAEQVEDALRAALKEFSDVKFAT